MIGLVVWLPSCVVLCPHHWLKASFHYCYNRNLIPMLVLHITFQGWWNDLLHEKNYKQLDYSGKMVLLLDILTMSTDVGDKVLVFSQSIPTLDLIELYLSRLPRRGKHGKLWKKGKDWYRCVQFLVSLTCYSCWSFHLALFYQSMSEQS